MSDGDRRVLPNVSVQPEFLGRTYFEWGKMGVPTILVAYLTVYVLPATLQPVGFALCVVIALFTISLIIIAPPHLTAGQFLEQRINYHVQQPAMIHEKRYETEEDD